MHPAKSSRPKAISPDEAAGIMHAHLADINARRRSPLTELKNAFLC